MNSNNKNTKDSEKPAPSDNPRAPSGIPPSIAPIVDDPVPLPPPIK